MGFWVSKVGWVFLLFSTFVYFMIYVHDERCSMILGRRQELSLTVIQYY